MTITTTVSITELQKEWIDVSCISLSRFVQKKIDEEMNNNEI